MSARLEDYLLYFCFFFSRAFLMGTTKMTKKMEKSSEEDSQGSVPPLWVRITALLLLIGSKKLKISKHDKIRKLRKVARKIIQGRFPPSGFVLLPFCS